MVGFETGDDSAHPDVGTNLTERTAFSGWRRGRGTRSPAFTCQFYRLLSRGTCDNRGRMKVFLFRFVQNGLLNFFRRQRQNAICGRQRSQEGLRLICQEPVVRVSLGWIHLLWYRYPCSIGGHRTRTNACVSVLVNGWGMDPRRTLKIIYSYKGNH